MSTPTLRIKPSAPSFETSVACRRAPGDKTVPTVDPMPHPWGANRATTAFLSGWWDMAFTSPEDCLTHDPADSARSGRILVPKDAPYRIVLNFEHRTNPWDHGQFDRMELYRAKIKAKHPNLILSAYVYQGRSLLDERASDANKHADMLKRFAEPFDEITPSLYFGRGDDFGLDPTSARGISGSFQHRTMRGWAKSLAPGKPLSPSVWWMVKGTGGGLVTRTQFMGFQVGAALSVAATRAVILWGDVNGLAEQRAFDSARSVFS